MRTFEKTHAWLTFQIDLTREPADVWLLLGECQAMCDIMERIPLRPDVARDLNQVFLAKGVHATTAIEGNTLSEEEVRRRIQGELPLPPSREYLGIEADNIIAVCNEIVEGLIENDAPPLTPERIEALNGRVLSGLELEDEVRPGKVRDHEVGVARYRGAPAADCKFLLGRLCEWLDGEAFTPSAGQEIVFALIKAAVAHLYLAWIHPFGDGNGRVARLVEFQILVQAGVPAPAAHLLSNHYNQTRTQYYRELDRSSRSGGAVGPFLRYAIRGFRDGLTEQFEMILGQVQDVAWRNYVHEAFAGKTSVAQTRRRHLALDLSQHAGSVPKDGIRDISPRIARAYAGLQDKALSRDLNALKRMALIAENSEGYRARREVILAFIPLRATRLNDPSPRS